MPYVVAASAQNNLLSAVQVVNPFFAVLLYPVCCQYAPDVPGGVLDRNSYKIANIDKSLKLVDIVTFVSVCQGANRTEGFLSDAFMSPGVL